MPPSITTNAPSIIIDQSTQQIQLLQQQLLNQQARYVTQLQQQQTANTTALNASQLENQNKINNAIMDEKGTIWANISRNNIKQLCENVTSTNSDQLINKFKDINVGKMCATIEGKSTIKHNFPLSNANIATDMLNENNVVPYCNSNATSNLRYQTEPCVCNQFGPNPVLNKGTYSIPANIIGLGGSTITGYYCS